MTDAAAPLVATDWLAERLGAPGLVVADATYHLPNTGRDGRDELHHLAADMAAAEAWRSEHGYRNAVLELVGDPDPILLPSRLGRAA